MDAELTAAPRATGCPSCGASVRPDALWCGQCYADFRPTAAPEPPPAPPTVPAPTALYGVAAGDPLTQPLLEFLTPVADVPAPLPATAVEEPTWPCSRCQAQNVLSVSSCAVCGGGFLAGVTDSDKPLLVLPVVGDLGAMSRGRRLGLAAAVVAAVVVLIAAITFLLAERAPEQPAGGTVTSVTISP